MMMDCVALFALVVMFLAAVERRRRARRDGPLPIHVLRAAYGRVQQQAARGAVFELDAERVRAWRSPTSPPARDCAGRRLVARD